MKVRELIEQLQRCDPEQPVRQQVGYQYIETETIGNDGLPPHDIVETCVVHPTGAVFLLTN